MIVGLANRAGIGESEEFNGGQGGASVVAKAPIVEVVDSSRRPIILVVGVFLGYRSLTLIAINYLVSYGTDPSVGFTRSEMLTASC
ncbi:hypothetical protein I1A62_06070 (plasmid) [Rhodococcus sp. USK10]|uniref:hypothetical protein n=1 Tax=Rhodococcus sp. USK10 TaxID=2789739 RepID=UPI001C5D7D8C|nr:hypothetical protein [Rhodococcus sp. USK10]QYB00534.1 hypothetical protein I1A62_06070 [Rhodococcus sp. USK10]